MEHHRRIIRWAAAIRTHGFAGGTCDGAAPSHRAASRGRHRRPGTYATRPNSQPRRPSPRRPSGKTKGLGCTSVGCAVLVGSNRVGETSRIEALGSVATLGSHRAGGWDPYMAVSRETVDRGSVRPDSVSTSESPWLTARPSLPGRGSPPGPTHREDLPQPILEQRAGAMAVEIGAGRTAVVRERSWRPQASPGL